MTPYTAYEDQNSNMAMGVAKDIATYKINPKSYTWAYTHMPSMWSGTKGLALPFNIDKAKQAGTAIKGAFSKGDYFGGISKSLASPFQVLTPFGGGTRIAAAGANIPETKKLIGHYSRLESIATRDINLKRSRIGEILFERRSRIGSVKSAVKTRSSNFYMIPDDLRQLNFAISSRNKYEPQARRWVKSHVSQLKELSDKKNKYTNKLYGLKSKLATQRITKWGLRAGKAVSIVGAITFAWDIAKMIGEPIGRAAVSEIDQIATRFQNQFMPELGGELNLAYLSRGAATERQRALNAMSKAQITGRSAFGQESKYQHM